MIRSRVVSAAILSLAMSLTSVPAFAQSSDIGVTGAGASIFPGGAQFNGIPVSGLRFGQGIFIASDGTAAGVFQSVLLGTSLLGQPQDIAVAGKVSSGSIGPDGSATFSGNATVDMGDGTGPLLGVPFTVTVSGQGVSTLLLTVGGLNLPNAMTSEGSITIQ